MSWSAMAELKAIQRLIGLASAASPRRRWPPLDRLAARDDDEEVEQAVEVDNG